MSDGKEYCFFRAHPLELAPSRAEKYDRKVFMFDICNSIIIFVSDQKDALPWWQQEINNQSS
jgi:hypothetical protein